MTPTTKHGLQSTYHRDGTISHWDAIAQQWRRCPADVIADAVLASMTDAERARIARLAEVA